MAFDYNAQTAKLASLSALLKNLQEEGQTNPGLGQMVGNVFIPNYGGNIARGINSGTAAYLGQELPKLMADYHRQTQEAVKAGMAKLTTDFKTNPGQALADAAGSELPQVQKAAEYGMQQQLKTWSPKDSGKKGIVMYPSGRMYDPISGAVIAENNEIPFKIMGPESRSVGGPNASPMGGLASPVGEVDPNTGLPKLPTANGATQPPPLNSPMGGHPVGPGNGPVVRDLRVPTQDQADRQGTIERGKQFGQNTANEFKDLHIKAQSAANSIPMLNEAAGLVEQASLGQWANVDSFLRKVGRPVGADTTPTQKTEILLQLLADQTLQVLNSLKPASNQDLEWATKMLGNNAILEPATVFHGIARAQAVAMNLLEQYQHGLTALSPGMTPEDASFYNDIPELSLKSSDTYPFTVTPKGDKKTGMVHWGVEPGAKYKAAPVAPPTPPPSEQWGSLPHVQTLQELKEKNIQGWFITPKGTLGHNPPLGQQ